MFLTRKSIVRILLVSIVFLSPYFAKAVYVPTPRDTSLPPVEMEITSTNVDELLDLGTYGDLSYYWRESTDVIKIVDNRNGYTWSTGLDLQDPSVLEDACNEIEDDYEDQLDALGITGVGAWEYVKTDSLSRVELGDGQIKLTSMGINDTHTPDTVTLTLSDLEFENGKDYTIQFDMYSSVYKEINMKVGFEDGGFVEIKPTELLETENQGNDAPFETFEFTFTMNEATTSDAVIIFELGYISAEGTSGGVTITYLDNFGVYENDGAIIEETNQTPYGDMIIPDENLTIQEADVREFCKGEEYRLNPLYMPWANSLVTINYFKDYQQGGTVPSPIFASSSFDWEYYKANYGGSFLYDADSTLYDVVGEDDHKIFEVIFTVRDKTIPPTCPDGVLKLHNGVCVAYEVSTTCPEEGWFSIEGECVAPDPVCEQGFVVEDKVCVEAEEGSVVKIKLKVHIYLEETGLRMQVFDEEIEGNGEGTLVSVQLAPWMGASGGMHYAYDIQELRRSFEPTPKDLIPGYSFIPDGSGALIRFKDLSVNLDKYKGEVYGTNYTQKENHFGSESFFKPLKTASMPVYGVAHGNNQNAFVAYATSGDNYMTIYSNPDEHDSVKYNFTYAEFTYNQKYYQVYNKSGAGYFSIYEDRNQFDIEMNYRFLQGDGSEDGYSADYVGMANFYRDVLIDNGTLHEVTPEYTDVPIRLDFFMSDVEKSIFGYTNMVTTDVDGVRSVLNDILDEGITNINSGLLGWNDGGVTLGDPSDVDFTRQIGSKRQFDALISEFNDEGVDISFAQDYFEFSDETMTERRNAARHTNNWYSLYSTFNYPISYFYYARPEKSIEWMLYQTDKFNDLGVSSYTIDGITNNLISDYTEDQDRADTRALILNGFGELSEDKLINAVEPNQYLWPYVDRYINTPVFSSQYLIETDTVPFLQLVLQGTMELYAPYSNFSFYTDIDILRMIDYNVYPSYVLSKEPSFLLADTNSRNFFSTEYSLYEDSLADVYNKVNESLGQVIDARWIDREVVENGVIVNYYDNGVMIIINYTEETINFEGTEVTPVSFSVVGG